MLVSPRSAALVGALAVVLASSSAFAKSSGSASEDAVAETSTEKRDEKVKVALGDDSVAVIESSEPQEKASDDWRPRYTLHSSLYAVADAKKRSGKESKYDMELAGARVGIEYEFGDWLETEVEVDFKNKAKLRDAYLRAKAKQFALKIGHFKSSSSALLMESRWSSPAANRGFVGEILKDEFLQGGRQTGAQLEWQRSGPVEIRSSIGTFLPSGLDGEQGSQKTSTTPTISGRVEARIKHLRVGAFAAQRANAMDDSTTQHVSGGGDVAVALSIGKHRARLWGEYVTGSIPISTMDTPQTGVFVSLRVLAAIKFRVMKKPKLYVEPYARLAIVDPDRTRRGDSLQELSVGVNLAAFKQFRMAVQAAFHDTSPFTKEVVDAKSRQVFTVFTGAAF